MVVDVANVVANVVNIARLTEIVGMAEEKSRVVADE